MTETTNKTVDNAGRNVLYYDGTCGFCCRGINRIRKALASIGVEVEPFENGAVEPEMVLRWHDGRVLGGADAAIFLAGRFPLGWLPAVIAGIPPFVYLVRATYKRIAKNRHCLGKTACEIDFGDGEKDHGLRGWLVTGVLVTAAFAVGTIITMPAWIWMWILAFAMWLGFKLMCYDRAGGFTEINPAFFFWPGMDTAGFAWDNRGRKKEIPTVEPLLFVVASVLLILALPAITEPLLKGWVGVAAMISGLHFGVFVWLAALWNWFGFGADPIMRKPWLGRGIGDFWGNRWNRGFSDWARLFLFVPLNGKYRPASATMIGFIASGLAHELVISVPARGGYGLPTLYFLIQGAALLIEKKAGLRRRKLARAWMWLVILLPAPLLFHRTFIEAVMNPMTNTITKLWTY